MAWAGPSYAIVRREGDHEDGLADAESELAAAKDRIAQDLGAWDAAKRAANPYELVNASSVRCRVRPVSRSFFKLWEISTEFPGVAAAARAGHAAMAAEGPGGFAQAALERGCGDVRVVTLVSGSAPRMRVSDHRVRCVTGDGSGDVTRPRVRASFVSAARGASLYTADGGFDVCGAFEEQEAQSAGLVEIEVALGTVVLRPGGALVVKFFDVFTSRSRAALSWVAACFETAYVYKPCTSRPANSERYAVGLGFVPCAVSRALEAWLVKSGQRPGVVPEYAQSIDAIGRSLAQRQTRHIEGALALLHPHDGDAERAARRQLEYALRWCQRHGMHTTGRDLADFHQRYRLKI